MTEEQRRGAITLCNRILETAARIDSDLKETKGLIEATCETLDGAAFECQTDRRSD